MHGSGVFHNRLGWGAGNSERLEAENHPIEKEHYLQKKNSMGSTVDFSGEYGLMAQHGHVGCTF